MKNILYILIVSTVFTQSFITNLSHLDKCNIEIKSIKSNYINQSLFMQPFVETEPDNNTYFNLLNRIHNDESFILEPLMAIRYSSQGHEMYNSEVPGSVTWITPGLKMHSTRKKLLWDLVIEFTVRETLEFQQ